MNGFYNNLMPHNKLFADNVLLSLVVSNINLPEINSNVYLHCYRLLRLPMENKL